MYKLFAFFFLMFSVLLGNCQTEAYQFNHLTSADGLSQSAVIAMHQDQLGRIWIGTRDGLNKYDGTKFEVYRTDEDNPRSISNNDILSIHEDNDGFIWIGTYNGLNKYNPETNEFKRYFHNEEKNSLANNTIWTIEVLSSGEVWFGTSKGLSIYNKLEDNFNNYLYEFDRPVQGEVTSIFESSNKDVYIGTGAGIYKINLKGTSPEFSILKGSEGFFVQDLEQGDSHIFIATRNNGLFRYQFTKQTFKPYLSDHFIDPGSKNVRQLLFDDHGALWVGTYNGLIIINKDKSTTTLKANIANKNGLSKNSIKALFKDKKGSIWVGTYYGGINIWDETNVNFRSIIQKFGGGGLNYSVVSSIESYKDLILFGTEGGGISVWNKTSNKFWFIDEHNSELSGTNIKALKVIEDFLYVGTFKNGIEIYNLKTKRFENSKIPKNLYDILSSTGVYAIEKDKLNNIWIGSFGQGIFKYSVDNKSFKRIQSSQAYNIGLSSNLVRTICISSNNNIWVGTEKGLNKIVENEVVETFFYDAKVQYGDDILCVYEDTLKNLWVGTKSKGLYKFNGETLKPVNLSLNGSKISAVHSVLEENEGQIWLSTNLGLIRFNPTNNEAHLYNQTDGIVSNEFNDNASLKINKTQFYFGGPEGVTYFDSGKIKTNKCVPQVILTQFNIRENKDDNDSSKPVSKKTLPFTKSVKLSHTQGNFSVSFSIPNFINSSNNKYKYRLKGLEEKWNLTTGNSASYTIQNPGDYIFQVKGANNDNIWNGKPTELKIRVDPAPWRTWWAFVIYGLLILGALYFLLHILKSRTKLKHDLQLEHLETERTKELNKVKLEFFTNISHEFRTPLALILGPLQQVIEDYSGSNKVYKKLLVIENSANHLLQLINRLMDFRKLEKNLYKLETAEGNIVKFLKEIYLSFSEFAEDGNYTYQFLNTSDEILVYYDRAKLERVFYNLISNAFRYTPKGGTIIIRIGQIEEEVFVSVEDTGVGIADEYRDKIFERFYEVAINNKPDNDYNKGTGIGLSIAKNIVDLHKGEISVSNNNDGLGSIFKVKLLLGCGHLSDEEIIKDFKFSDDVSQYIEQLKPQVNPLGFDVPDIANSEKQTILIVEDNKPLRKFMKGVLDGSYNILEAENGHAGFKIAKKEFPDLIVSDVVMPVMTGTELCAKIKDDVRTSHIPLILLTSRTSLVYKLEGLERGADDYISKPFDIKEFKLRVKNLLKATTRLKERFTEEGGLNPSQVTVTSVDEVLYKKAVRIVEQHIGNNDFDVPFFASELGVSRTMLFTKIKAWSNFTPNEFVLHFRMNRAAQLLEQQKINVSEVSYMVGFKNPKYFSKSFQKKFGKTPTQYAKKFNED
ncbi:two-component regulator propeller domain-containing protein [Cognatitamlana onchidii]|uniref:two-component regulator propeller domain-containing protein n=1 Tax=Cognatitamlana onchidii TaxID=2562860 RepID=UPI0010A688CF|nr:two-component regulator propeller domain-containing protein [Algibacter onchidii]